MKETPNNRHALRSLFPQKVRRYILQEKLCAEGERLIVALSGGADSVALLRVLLSSGYPCEAAHCNFHLRGEESERDEQFVQRLCEKLHVPLHVRHFDTTAYARTRHLSIEMAARELRYDYFEELALRSGIKRIAVAHHRDDSVETFLLNLLRGTGPDGLCGIRPRNGRIIRPLLAVTRQEILSYLKEMGQDYVTDSTNLHDDYTRNKIRLRLLPLLEEINPSVRLSIATTAGRIAEVAALSHRLTNEGRKRVVHPLPEGGEGAFEVSLTSLREEPLPQSLLFELLHPLGFRPAQIDALYAGLDGEPGRRFLTGEWEAVKDRTTLLVTKRKADMEEETYELFPDKTLTLDNGELTVRREERDDSFVLPRGGNEVCLDGSKLTFPLTVRRVQRGDRFVPLGMRGTRKLSDYMTDRKFSLLRKRQQRVVCCGDKIVWVVGERPDNRYRVEEGTHRLVRITYKPAT